MAEITIVAIVVETISAAEITTMVETISATEITTMVETVNVAEIITAVVTISAVEIIGTVETGEGTELAIMRRKEEREVSTATIRAAGEVCTGLSQCCTRILLCKLTS